MLEPENIALLIAVLAGFLPPFDLSVVNIALPTIPANFPWTLSRWTGWQRPTCWNPPSF